MSGLELYLQAIIAGGITGYVTNVTAVKMLFKKVLGFGGVIIETREEFIKNVSQLVERDIINHGTLDSELSKDEFITEGTKIINDFLQIQLYEVTPDIKLGQVPKMPQSIDNLRGFLSDNQGETISEAIKIILEGISLKEVLSEKQVEVLAGQAIGASLDIFRETEILESFISSLYLQYKEDTLADFIAPKVLQVVTENLNEATDGLHLTLKQDYDHLVQQLMDDLYAQLDVSELVVEVEKIVKNKTLIELLGRTHAENISNELLVHIIRFLQSPEGKKLSEQASDYLFRVAKEVHMPLFNLFKPELASNLEDFISSKLPGLVKELILWFKENQDGIENKIEKALQSALSQEYGPRAEMKKFLYNILTKRALANKFQVVAKVIEGIENKVDVRILSEEITAGIISYLKRTNMSEIVCSLENRGIFTSHDITRLIEGNLDNLVARIDLKAADSYFNTKLGDIFKISFAKPVESYIKGLLMKAKGEFLYTGKFSETFQNELKVMIQEISTRKLSALFQGESGDFDVLKFKNLILAQLEIRRDDLVTAVVQQSQKIMGDKKLREVLNTRIEDQATEKLSKMISLYTKDRLEEFQLTPIYSFYDRVNAVPDVGIRLTSASIDLLNNNLENITKGQIEAVVATNLSKLSNEQLQEMVEDFMGKELKPISWLGALIGAFAGLGFGFVKSMFHISGSWSMAFSVPVYGFVGYITNKQALWMIFHPYRPWRIFGKDVPLTQGVIVKSKPRFAKSMARFVGEDLLNPQSSMALFQKNRGILYHTFLKSIAQDNYKRVENLLLANISDIASALLTGGFILAGKHNQKWNQNLIDELQGIPLKELGLEHLREVIGEDRVDLLARIQPAVVDSLDRIIHDEKALRDILPDKSSQFVNLGFVGYIDTHFNQLRELLQNREFLDKTLAPTLKQTYSILVAKSLKELLGDDKKEKVKNKIMNLILEQLQAENSQRKIQELIREKIVKELDAHKKISHLFDGKVIQIIEEHLDPILAILTEKATIFLDSERESFKSAAKQEAREAKGDLYFLVVNSLLDIDFTIDNVVDYLVDKTAPEIMLQSRRDLESVVLNSLAKIGDSSIDEIGINITEQGIIDVVTSLLNNQTLYKHLRVFSGGILESLTNLPLERLLRVAGITKVEDVLHTLEAELSFLQKSTNDCLAKKEEEIKIVVARVITGIFDDMVLGLSVRSVFKEVDRKEIGQTVSETFAKIKQSRAFDLALKEFTEALIDKAKDKELREIIDPAILRSDFSKAFSVLLMDGKTKSELQARLESTLKTCFLSMNNSLEKETKDFVTAIVVESILNSLEGHIPDLVKTLDMGNITEREINKMEPKEIEDLFNSFAGSYFRKLEYYGLWGGLLGLTIEVLLRNLNLPSRF